MMAEERPWGKYEILLDSPTTKVKKITVDPGKRISYQYHYKRSEIWTIVEGDGIFTLNDQTEMVCEGMTVKIPTQARHRIENHTQDPLVFIEVQIGSYFGEDDIVRIEDDWNRK